MSEELEPTVLEYARHYGIALDHLGRDPLHECPPPENILAQLEDPPGAFRIDKSIGSLPLERLSATTEAVVLLNSITGLGQQSSGFDKDIAWDVHRFRNIKLEWPILLTDHELDLQNFAPRIVPDLENEHLPLEILDDEADEGLNWPSVYYGLSEKFFNEARAEKLDPSKDALLYLQDVLRSIPNDRDAAKFEHDGLLYKKVSRGLSSEALMPPQRNIR